jgi:hypothetical protein
MLTGAGIGSLAGPLLLTPASTLSSLWMTSLSGVAVLLILGLALRRSSRRA